MAAEKWHRSRKSPPLSATNTASIHQSRGTASAVARHPLVNSADADPHLSSKEGEAFTVINVSSHQQLTAKGVSRETGWACMGCEVSRSAVTPGP